MSRTDPQINIRLPADLLQRVAAAATENNRSTTAEIAARLDASGETLRDRFAMAALTAYLSRPDADDRPYAEIADWCFDMADAMLAMRGPS